MLVSMKELLQPARQYGSATDVFNVADNCSLRTVMDKAETTSTPTTITIHPSERGFVDDALFAHVCGITQHSPVPFVLHLDHGAFVEYALRAIRCGFTSAMIDGLPLPYEENMALTAETVRLVHAVGVSIEDEPGATGQTGAPVEGGASQVTYIDPMQATGLIARTDADILTVVIGTARGIYPKRIQLKLQMDISCGIARRIDIPLVLRGGSANPDAEITESVALGVGKANVSSDMKHVYFQKVCEVLTKESWWDSDAIYLDAINAMREVTRHKTELFGLPGKTSLY